MKNVLLIEDDKEISNLLEIHLKDIDCKITKAFDGVTGLKLAQAEVYDFIVLDVMLPLMDGFEVVKEIRKCGILSPVMMLTSKSQEIDKVLGLEFGADDYLTKPFSLREFIARVKAIFRMVESLKPVTPEDKNIKIGELVVNVAGKKVNINGKRIDLTPKEFDLLYLLASHPGHVYSRERLLNSIWGYQYSGFEHTVNSHINRLRSKIEKDASNPHFILTNWGTGYMFNDQII